MFDILFRDGFLNESTLRQVIPRWTIQALFDARRTLNIPTIDAILARYHMDLLFVLLDENILISYQLTNLLIVKLSQLLLIHYLVIIHQLIFHTLPPHRFYLRCHLPDTLLTKLAIIAFTLLYEIVVLDNGPQRGYF